MSICQHLSCDRSDSRAMPRYKPRELPQRLACAPSAGEPGDFSGEGTHPAASDEAACAYRAEAVSAGCWQELPSRTKALVSQHLSFAKREAGPLTTADAPWSRAYTEQPGRELLLELWSLICLRIELLRQCVLRLWRRHQIHPGPTTLSVAGRDRRSCCSVQIGQMTRAIKMRGEGAGSAETVDPDTSSGQQYSINVCHELLHHKLQQQQSGNRATNDSKDEHPAEQQMPPPPPGGRCSTAAAVVAGTARSRHAEQNPCPASCLPLVASAFCCSHAADSAVGGGAAASSSSPPAHSFSSPPPISPLSLPHKSPPRCGGACGDARSATPLPLRPPFQVTFPPAPPPPPQPLRSALFRPPLCPDSRPPPPGRTPSADPVRGPPRSGSPAPPPSPS